MLNPDICCQENDDDDEEEIEDMTIKPTDAVILCARNEDEVNLLEVCTILFIISPILVEKVNNTKNLHNNRAICCIFMGSHMVHLSHFEQRSRTKFWSELC